MESTRLLTGCYIAWYPFRSNQEIQTYAIALINALFLKAPEDRRQVSAQQWRKRSKYTKQIDIARILIMFHPHVTL